MSKTSKTIDYLFEDPPIQNQQFALVSIVGPNMPQKCDVWGLKVRGTAESEEKAKQMAQKLMRVDNNYDVYTVEVGKFFPLAVEPHDVGNVEYENNQLNELIKSYLKNREVANEHWTKRKNDMIQEAIREGKNQEEVANRPEHPISVLQRVRNLEESVEDAKQQLAAFEEDLQRSKEKFDTYTDEEREIANKELQSAITANTQPTIPEEEDMSVQDIRKQLMAELDVSKPAQTSAQSNIEAVIDTIREKESELEQLQKVFAGLNQSQTPAVYDKMKSDIEQLETSLVSLKSELQNTQKVNEYINSSYSGEEYAGIFEKDPNYKS
jgi:uncharacterized protein YukE